MTDPRFFKSEGPFSLGELAQEAGAKLSDEGDRDLLISGVAALDDADGNSITFLDNIKYKPQLQTTKAAACIISPHNTASAPDHLKLVISDNAYEAFARIAAKFFPEQVNAASISDSACIDKSAKISDGCAIKSGAIIQDGVQIGKNTVIESGAVIESNVVIGDGCTIGANAVLSHCIIGNNVRIYRGCMIGQDGFGFAVTQSGFMKVPQLGRVLIEDNVEIGANTTIDRGSAKDTIIGQGTWIDNLVQIAHNVHIGKYCIIIAQVGISGSTVIEDGAVLAGQVGVAGHIRVGKGARVGAQSGVIKDVPAGEEYLGSPSVPVKQFMRQTIALKRLVKKDK